MKYKILLTLVAGIVFSLTAAEPSQNSDNVWLTDIRPLTGLRIESKFCDLNIFSRIVVTNSPGWNVVYFINDNTSVKKEVDRHDPSILRLAAPPGSCLKEYSVRTEKNRWTIHAEAVPRKGKNLLVEYIAMMIPPEFLIPAGTFRGTDVTGKKFSDTLPSEKKVTPIVAADFKELELPGRYGSLKFEVREGPGFDLLDLSHKDIGYDEKRRGFQIEAKGVPLAPGKPFKSKIIITFTPHEIKPASLQQTAEDAVAKPIPAETINRHVKPREHLLPVPQNLEELIGQDFRVAVELPISFDPSFSPRLKKAAKSLLADRIGLRLKVGSAEKGVRIISDVSLKGNDAYSLQVTPAGIEIKALNERAAFYALQTLSRRFSNNVFKGCRISDFADIPLRGIHLMTDRNALEHHGKLIRHVLAPLKMNHIFLECEYVKWDATVDFHHRNAMSKEDLVKLLAIARENYIEVTPLLQTYGHCQWLFVDGKNLDLADDPDMPYDYDVSNPRLYPLMKRLLDEVVDIFQPRFLNIGHDEIRLAWRGPRRPASKAKGADRIILDDILWYHDYARRNNIRLIMAHDMLDRALRKETKFPKIREQLPRDIIIFYWNYDKQENYPQLDLFQKAGHEVIAGSWYHPGNIENFTQYAGKRNALGFINTTWAGYFGSAAMLRSMYPQVSAYVRAGCWSWNTDPAANNYQADRVLMDMLKSKAPAPEIVPGTMFDLSAFAVISFRKHGNPFGFGGTFGLEKLPLTPFFCGDIRFLAARKDHAPAALTLRSVFHPDAPERIQIPLRQKAAELYFLHTVANALRPGYGICTYKIEYEDGTIKNIPIRYRNEVNALSGPTNLRFNQFNSWYTENQEAISYYKWINPEPAKKIRHIILENGNYGQPIYLLGLSTIPKRLTRALLTDNNLTPAAREN